MHCSRIPPTDTPELICLIRRILEETGAHNAGRFTGDLWRWRYESLPTGETRVYGLYDGDRLRGYYHAPVYEGRLAGQPARYAVVQDVAMDPDLRGQGCFRRLAEFATADLAASDIDLIYTFPNARSIRTFTKYTGYRRVTSLPTYVLPLRAASLLAGRTGLPRIERLAGAAADRAFRLLPSLRESESPAVRVALDEPAVASVYAAFDPGARFHLARTPDWFAWRFDPRLAGEVFVMAAERNRSAATQAPGAGDLDAVAVFRIDKLFGASALLLMDYAHRPGTEPALLALILDAALHADARLGHPVDLVFAAGQTRFLPALIRAGFLPIPAWANPRPLNLLARPARRQPGATLCEPAFWHVTLADWDVF